MHRLTLSNRQSSELEQLWWVLVGVGLLSTAAGVVLVARPSNSLKTLAVIAGIFLLVDGIAALIASVGDAENRTVRVLSGVLGVVVGIALIRHPFHGVTTIGLLIGIWLVAVGGIRLVEAIVEGVRPWLRSGLAAIEIAAGAVIVSDPHIGYTALALITGIWLIANGIGTVALALAFHGAEREVHRTRQPFAEAEHR
jgi:uncharacterized membrane protein HdeD (DUF308 family)